MNNTKKIRVAGLLYLLGMLAGVFSVSPAIDSSEFLTNAVANSNQVIFAAIFQFVMALSYIGIAILLYPTLRKFSRTLAIGFLSFRISAVTLSVIGTILILSILALSREFVQYPSTDTSALQPLGNVFKASRDSINHVFMVLVLGIGNLMLYILLIKSKLIPVWLSVWGLVGTSLSAIASILVLFQVVEIITSEYLALNAPTALQELVLGLWLMFKGFYRV
jgi:hypothetical protein